VTAEVKILRTEEDGIRRYVTPNGELKSVTTFQQLLSKPALVPWAAKMTAEYFKDELDAIITGELDIRNTDLEELVKNAKAHYKKKSEEAMEYGTAVHGFVTEFFAFGALPEDPVMAKLVVAAVSKITGELGMTVTATEKVVYYKSMYAGTLDINGVGKPSGHSTQKNIIVDIKTGRGRVYDEALQQVSAYALAWESMFGAPVDLAVILPLNKDTGEAGDLVYLPRRKWKKYAKSFIALCRYSAEIDKCKADRKKKK
jgi:CRISPR/Cas system-associated exonuclease Cas4 (RecB family)